MKTKEFMNIFTKKNEIKKENTFKKWKNIEKENNY